MTDKTDKTKTGSTSVTNDADNDASPEKSGRRTSPALDVAKGRTLLAKLVWTVCVVFAAALAAEVLLIAIEANEQNSLVTFVRDFADKVDLGFFDLSDPIKDFDEKVPNFSDTGTALFNYGIAAIVWLVIGRVADRVIRP